MNFKKLFALPILGVDLGTRNIKGVQLKRKGERVLLTHHFFQDLSATTENYPEGANLMEAFRAAIEVEKLRSAKAAISLRDSEIETLSFQLPRMKPKELVLAIEHEIDEQSPNPISEVSYDYVLVPPPAGSSEGDTVTVQAYCAKRAVTLEKMKLLENAGLSCGAVESELLAITAMLDFNDYLLSDQVQVVIDLGESHLSLGLISEGELKLTRQSEIGMGIVNRALMERFAMTYEAAETHKLKYDFSIDATTQSETAAEIHQCIDDALTQIFRSIKECIDFFRACPESHGRLDQILLIGGGSQVRDIEKVHKLFFKVPGLVVNTFKNIDIYTNPASSEHEEIAKLAPYMGAAVGMALRSIEETA